MKTPLRNGDIVLVSFPFTDLSGSKLRPAVIISENSVHRETSDYTLLFLSSVIVEPLSNYELKFPEEHPDFRISGLKKTSVFKTNKIATIQEHLIKRKLGALGNEIRKELAEVFGKTIRV
ncbi:MAG: type II toxin-antitoxin system PemK/MazF family toxin [Deltaproteobacteria bacterium]|nr:type II toxin-antitoxin system PemK/MazF family toxin [Deltaproteobacteria bacterium]